MMHMSIGAPRTRPQQAPPACFPPGAPCGQARAAALRGSSHPSLLLRALAISQQQPPAVLDEPGTRPPPPASRGSFDRIRSSLLWQPSTRGRDAWPSSTRTARASGLTPPPRAARPRGWRRSSAS
jgi:hypothetical protein